MFFGLLKNKWFWIFWLLLSISGGILGKYLTDKKKTQLANSETAICIDFRSSEYPSIIVIRDTTFKKQYLNALNDSSIKTVNFKFFSIDNKKEVKVIEYSKDKELALIGITNQEVSSVSPPYEEGWVYTKFLKKK